MNSKKSIALFLQLGFWICYLLLIMVILAALFGNDQGESSDRIERVFQGIFYFSLIPSAISFYSFYYIIFPNYVIKKKYLQTIGMGFLFAFIGGLLGYLILRGVFGDSCLAEGGADEEEGFLGVVLFMTLEGLISGTIALVINGFLKWVEEIKLKEDLVKKNHEMELLLVKSQLDPHFLFNTLNNIDVLILKNAEEASEYLNRLSDIMRFMLYETKTDEIALSKELEYIDKYISLQRIRTANTNYIKYNVIGTPKDLKIAPMLFIPFIENAFKHTSNKKLNEAIQIEIEIGEEDIKFSCINRFESTQKSNDSDNGLGNGLIKKRLDLLYPNKYHLDINKSTDIYEVILVIRYEQD